MTDMYPDKQKALSLRYRGFWVVPMPTGTVAVFTHPMGEYLGTMQWTDLPSVEPAPTIKLDASSIPRPLSSPPRRKQSLDDMMESLSEEELAELMEAFDE